LGDVLLASTTEPVENKEQEKKRKGLRMMTGAQEIKLDQAKKWTMRQL
jgi:hypothetical protein